MIFSKNNSTNDSNGVAALAMVKVLLDIMEKKQILTKDEIAILLNCAEVEVDSSDSSSEINEAKMLIRNLMTVSDDTTRGYNGTTG
ncbi:MAG: hypothetical protein GKR93_08870 [Gammaproteobacteria bacterium]|nr:hypothetical protein [Gammaproteobacteria bacterium]